MSCAIVERTSRVILMTYRRKFNVTTRIINNQRVINGSPRQVKY